MGWLQSDIDVLPKGLFLAHFVQLLPVSSGLDPKPIKATGGFQFNSKGFESGHSVCLQQKFAEHNRDHRNLHVDLNRVHVLCDRGKGVDLLRFLFGWLVFGGCWGGGVGLLAFFNLQALCLRQGLHFPFRLLLPFSHCWTATLILAACATERLPRAWAQGRQAPWRTWWHIIPTYSLSAPMCHRLAPCHQHLSLVGLACLHGNWTASRACLWPCHLLLSSLKCEELKHCRGSACARH